MQNYSFQSITMNEIKKIESWRYKGYIKSIYMEPYHQNYNKKNDQTTGPDKCDGYAVFKEKVLFGLFECYFYDSILEIGLAIHPDYTNKGFSTDFIKACISYAIEHYNYQEPYIQLKVNKKNIVAYKAYKKANFLLEKETNEAYLMHYVL